MSNNLNTIFIIIIFIIIAISCTSFENHRQFSYEMLANPDSLESIYKNSTYCDSLFEAKDMDYFFRPQAKEMIRKYFSGGKYQIFEEKHYLSQATINTKSKRICYYVLIVKSIELEYYITFVFKNIQNKWILVSMPLKSSLTPIE